jgi:hypothetical protein
MIAVRIPAPDGQLANVSVVLVAKEQSGFRETAHVIARLFDDVVIVSSDASLEEFGQVVDPGPRCAITVGLETALEERVLVVVPADEGARIPAELLLGLTAWPEHECVAPVHDGRVDPSCALVGRKAALESLSEPLPATSPLHALMGRLDSSAIEGDDLAALLGTRTALS